MNYRIVKDNSIKLGEPHHIFYVMFVTEARAIAYTNLCTEKDTFICLASGGGPRESGESYQAKNPPEGGASLPAGG
jgi:hypothetical protein